MLEEQLQTLVSVLVDVEDPDELLQQLRNFAKQWHSFAIHHPGSFRDVYSIYQHPRCIPSSLGKYPASLELSIAIEDEEHHFYEPLGHYLSRIRPSINGPWKVNYAIDWSVASIDQILQLFPFIRERLHIATQVAELKASHLAKYFYIRLLTNAYTPGVATEIYRATILAALGEDYNLEAWKWIAEMGYASEYYTQISENRRYTSGILRPYLTVTNSVNDREVPRKMDIHTIIKHPHFRVPLWDWPDLFLEPYKSENGDENGDGNGDWLIAPVTKVSPQAIASLCQQRHLSRSKFETCLKYIDIQTLQSSEVYIFLCRVLRKEMRDLSKIDSATIEVILYILRTYHPTQTQTIDSVRRFLIIHQLYLLQVHYLKEILNSSLHPNS